MNLKKNISIVIVLTIFNTVTGQVLDPNDMLLDYYKMLELKNPQMDQRIGIHPSIVNSYQRDSLTWNPWSDYLLTVKEEKKSFQLLPARVKSSVNTNYSRSYNDGAVWQGKGLTMQAQGGFTGRHGRIRYTFAPIIYWSQNSSFALAENASSEINQYNYQFNVRGFIDYVQRFGPNSFFDWHLGQSEVRAVFNWFTVGLSTQNIVFGPGQRNHIILGNSGGMIPHIDLGTDRPIVTSIGKIEGKMYWGRMSESDYNNEITTGNPAEANPVQYFTALSLSYSPKWVKGFSLGANRVFYKRWQDFVFEDFISSAIRFNSPEETVFGNDDLDQTASLTMRWTFPEVGFEAYMEFAKSDFGGNVFRSEPDHARAITLGFIKVLEYSNFDIKLNYEHTTLGQPKNFLFRQYNRYYSHAVMKNGYTHRGQLLGAGIGPGSNGDWFDAKIYFKKSMIGGTLQRIRFDDDYFFANFSRKEQHDFEWTMGLQYERLMSTGRLGLEFNFSNRKSTYFIEGNDKTNVFASVSFVKPF
ncbi:capsule assembly Wzi family protein [Ekhidna sp.]